MAKQYKNDIFEVIKHIDNKDYQYFENLPEEKQKEIQPYVLMRWMSVCSNEKLHNNITQKINNNVNKNFWVLSKYKDLQWKLLCTTGSKQFVKHQWISGSKTSNDKLYNLVRKMYSDLSDSEFMIKYKSMSKEELDKIQQFYGLLDK